MPNPNAPITIGIAEDHTLVRNAVSNLINSSSLYRVSIEANNGKELLDFIHESRIPEIILLDINMPVMNGFETLAALRKLSSPVKVLALTAVNNEEAVFHLYHSGINGYLLKTAEPEEFFRALDCVASGENYFPELIFASAADSFLEKRNKIIRSLNERELMFLKYAAMDISYNEIAARMHLSRYTINDYRNSLFAKFNVHTRIGLVLIAAKYKIIEL